MHRLVPLIFDANIHAEDKLTSAFSDRKGPYHYSIKNSDNLLFEIYPTKGKTNVGFIIDSSEQITSSSNIKSDSSDPEGRLIKHITLGNKDNKNNNNLKYLLLLAVCMMSMGVYYHLKMKGINCDVLIVGGGPAGLAMANVLEKNGVSYVLVEQNNQPGIYSKFQQCKFSKN